MRFLACALAGLLLLLSPGAEAASRDLRGEEAHRKLVLDFYEQVFNRHDVAEGAKLLTETYKQHNPEVPDGKEPFVSFFTGFFKENPHSRARVVRSATSGDLVWLHVHSTNAPQDRGQAVIDIFRVANGRIVEHWDVIQAVPETAANDNSMF